MLKKVIIGALCIAMSMFSVPSMAAYWYGQGHKLKIKFDGSATKSFWVAGTGVKGVPNQTLNKCITFTPRRGWEDTAYVLKNGTTVKVLAFSSRNCTNGLRRVRRKRVPNQDGLYYIWFPLY